MDETTFKNLRRGDIVRHRIEKRGMIVTGNYGGRVTVVRTEDMTNSDERELIEKPLITTHCQ